MNRLNRVRMLALRTDIEKALKKMDAKEEGWISQVDYTLSNALILVKALDREMRKK